MFFLVSQYKIKYFPLKYNCPQFFDNDEQFTNKNYDTYMIKDYMNGQKNSPFKYTLDEIIEAESNHVLQHLFTTKPYSEQANKKNGKIWVNYAKLAKIYDKIKERFPKAVKLYE